MAKIGFTRQIKTVGIVVFFLGVILILCRLSTAPEFEEEVSYRDGDATFISETTLASIARGEIDVFTPMMNHFPAATPITVNIPPLWKSSDFKIVAQAFHKYFWKEPMDEWKIKEIHFSFDCKDTEHPDFAQYQLFKVGPGKSNSKESRFEHSISIDLSHQLIGWTEAEILPIKSYRPVDLANLKISPEVAVRIADENGGLEMRMANDNNCTISAWFLPYPGNWFVSYEILINNVLFSKLDAEINGRNGRIKITYPQTK